MIRSIGAEISGSVPSKLATHSASRSSQRNQLQEEGGWPKGGTVGSVVDIQQREASVCDRTLRQWQARGATSAESLTVHIEPIEKDNGPAAGRLGERGECERWIGAKCYFTARSGLSFVLSKRPQREVPAHQVLFSDPPSSLSRSLVSHLPQAAPSPPAPSSDSSSGAERPAPVLSPPPPARARPLLPLRPHLCRHSAAMNSNKKPSMSCVPHPPCASAATGARWVPDGLGSVSLR